MNFESVYLYQWIACKDGIKGFALNKDGERVCLELTSQSLYYDIYVENKYVTNPVEFEKFLYSRCKSWDTKRNIVEFQNTHVKLLYGGNSTGAYKITAVNRNHASNIDWIVSSVKKGRESRNVRGVTEKTIELLHVGVDQVLMFLTRFNLPSVGWIQVPTYKDLSPNLCKPDANIHLFKVGPKVLSFDLEVFSSREFTFPCASNAGDEIFQISCVIFHVGSIKSSMRKILITIGDKDFMESEDFEVIYCSNELELIHAFVDMVKNEKPQILTGYNICGFDISYLYERAKGLDCEFGIPEAMVGEKNLTAEYKKVQWSSSAYGDQNIHTLILSGMIVIDVMIVIKRDFKFDSYSLNNVSEHILKSKKDDVGVNDIMRAYRSYKQRTMGWETDMALVGKYCVQDSVLVAEIFEKLNIWYSVSEMASACSVGMNDIVTRGQQMKIFAQVFRYCHVNDIVINNYSYKPSPLDHYFGAHVFEPVKGIHHNVIPLDFASLYPSIIIAYNIDYSTWEEDFEKVKKSPDDYNILEWEEHRRCEHDSVLKNFNSVCSVIEEIESSISNLVKMKDLSKGKAKKMYEKELKRLRSNNRRKLIVLRDQRDELKKGISNVSCCAKMKYAFKKTPMGVIPTIVQTLLQKRKECRATMKTLENDDLLTVYNNRQLAFKVSANSMYGAMGASKGILPLMPGAISITRIGRSTIQKTCDIISTQYGGTFVYGDTDSNYVKFDSSLSIEELWNFAQMVAEKISDEFPQPMKLEFEEQVFSTFLIVSKKNYVYEQVDRKGNMVTVKHKGSVCVRRDKSKFLKNLYSDVVHCVFEKNSIDKVEDIIHLRIMDLIAMRLPLEDFIISESCGSHSELQYRDGSLYKGRYKIKPLTLNPVEREKLFLEKNVNSEKDYFNSQLPAPVQLCIRMKNRGEAIPDGGRIGYIVSNQSEKLPQAIETLEYFQDHHLRLNFLYYIESLEKALEPIFKSVYNKIVMKDIIKSHNMFQRCMKKIREWNPKKKNKITKYFKPL